MKKTERLSKAGNAPLPGKSYSQADLNAVMDNPEWTAGEIAVARPFGEVFPELMEAMRRGRGPQKRPTKERITIRLDRSTIDTFRATGDGWQTRMGEELTKAANRLKRRA